MSDQLDEAAREARRALARLASAVPLHRGTHSAEARTSVSVIDGDSWEAAVKLWRAHGQPLLSALPSRPCPGCTAVEARRLFDSYDGYTYVECSACGIWYVPLQVDWTLFERFRECCPEADRLVTNTARRRHESLREQDRSRLQGYIEGLVAFLLPAERSLRYLDIGCGVGHSLEAAMALGLVAHGVEADRTSKELAERSGGLVVDRAAALPEGMYDLVTLWETLEHLSDPATMIRMASARLAPGGLLSCSVPNGRASGLRIARERCSYVYGGFDSPGHINFFDVASLRKLFEAAGLRLVDTRQEFSTNLLEVLDALAGGERQYQRIPGARWPTALGQWVEALGPEISMLETVCGTLPMLHMTACRLEDEALYCERFEEVRKLRSRDFGEEVSARLAYLAGPALTISRMEEWLRERDATFNRMHDHLQSEVNLRDQALRDKEAEFRHMHDRLQGEVNVRDQALRDKEAEFRHMHDRLQGEVNVRDQALREKERAFTRMHEHLQREVTLRDSMMRDQHDAYLRLCEEVSRLRGMGQNGGE